MRSVAGAITTALADRRFVRRNFVWFTVKDRSTGITSSQGFWDDFGSVNVNVVDGLTGATVARDFIGAGSLGSLSKIPLTSDISVRRVTISLSQVSDDVALAVRGYDMRNAPVQVYRGIFDPLTRVLISSAFCRFVGYVDKSPINTPAVGQAGSIDLECVSSTSELLRVNSSVRSDGDQQIRAPGDRFYRWTGQAKDWAVWWGKENKTLKSHPGENKKGKG